MSKTTKKKPVSRWDRALIRQIAERAQRDYNDRFDEKRLTNALLAAHRATPIRLDDLLHTCYFDFYSDVVAGAYKHYDPKTDTMKNGWTPQHAQPKGEDRPSFEGLLRFLMED